MAKIAFLYPGQGSQIVGMGKDLFKEDKFFKELIECGSDFVSADLEKICLRGPDKELMKATNLQPLLTALSLGYTNKLKESGVEADIVMGHSLGEITSLGAAGILDPITTMKVSAKRGMLMDEAASKCNDGTMMAVLFVSIEEIKEILEEMGESEHIALANDNAPTQVIISGEREKLKRFDQIVNEKRMGGKCKPVFVSGPWHSNFIESARVAFKEWAAPLEFSAPKTKMIFNATSTFEEDPLKIKELVTWQLVKPVYWRESLETLKKEDVTHILEVGPGRVLAGLIRINKFPKSVTVLPVNDLKGVATVIDKLGS